MMSQLTLRTGPEDEDHLSFLEEIWGLDRSAATRKALALAAECVQQHRKSKMQVLQEYSLIGCYADEDARPRKKRVKEYLKKKHHL